MADLEHTPDFATVTWRGCKFNFSAQQRAAVKLLIEHRGHPLSKGYILEQIDSSSDRLRDVFKSRKGMHEAWTTLILTPPQHGLGRDLYLVPREIPAGTPEGPQAISDPSVSGSSIDEPKHEGERDMVSRLPSDSNEVTNWLDGAIPALCSDLVGERNFTRVLLRWGAITQRASKDEIRMAADACEAENLLSGLHYAVHLALGSESLSWLDGQLNALADAWGPSDESTDHFCRGRIVPQCRGAFTPLGVMDGNFDITEAASNFAEWLDSGDQEALSIALGNVPGMPTDLTNFTDDQLIDAALKALRAVKPLDGGGFAAGLAEAVEAKDAERTLGFTVHMNLQEDILDQVWAL